MINTRQSKSMSTAESYYNRAESATAAAYDKTKADKATAEEATVAAHAAATALVFPIASHHEAAPAPAAPDYPRSSDKNGQPNLKPDATPDNDNQVEHEENSDIKEEADDANKADDTNLTLFKVPKQEDGDYMDAPGVAGSYSSTQEVVH